jgi:flagellin
MPLFIHTNAPSLFAQNTLNKTQLSQDKTPTSAASLDLAASDPATSTVVHLFTSQTLAERQGITNLNDAVSFTQVALYSLQQLRSNTEKLRELALQAGNDALSNDDRAALQAKASQLTQANTDIIQNANYNDVPLLHHGTALSIEGDGEFTLDAGNMAALPSEGGLYSLAGVDFSSSVVAALMLHHLDVDISTLTNASATFEAANQAFSAAISNFPMEAEVQGRISDTDMAAAAAKLAQEQILAQPALAKAQANANPQLVLRLLKAQVSNP